ncbi:MAG: O-antigen ligase family protein [Daejeonella sp.]|uniref:O-antigen ligase family protein n=1 Tax=Daejeonella sp. TaxID=2805397 RepID=UPI002733CCDE|nr:O-antigen ligase family protein [Daejeonella sp.]MDP3467785.1 O-antigen ligase family protein [Daejeonella sp.]
MFIFALIYFSAFFIALKNLISRNKQGIFIFLIFGLPIYTTSLSVALQSGFADLVPLMQPFKEILILMTLGIGIWELKRQIRFQSIDYAILAYFFYTLLYVILPIGQYGLGDKLIAFKSSSFFTFIYFAGRIFDPARIYISKYYHYILAVFIAAAGILFFEIISNQHFQTLTGYADFNFYFFNQEASGNYDLSWTFETSTGLRRFASFFANPLEFAASTLLTLAILAGLYTTDDNRIKVDTLGIIAIIATQFSIFFALSRSSLASYFIMIFIYALITKKKLILNIIYAGFIAVSVYFIFFMLVMNPDLYEFIYETITFTNPSSIGHVLAWIEGIEAIAANPLGLGLGESGRVAVSLSDTVGGENQYIIIGVQTGILTLLLYLWMHIYFIKTCWKWFPKLQGKERQVCLSLLLMKIGFIIPLLTSELESSVYISYLSWFLSGLFVHMIAGHATDIKPLPVEKS